MQIPGRTEAHAIYYGSLKWKNIPKFIKPYLLGVMIPNHPEAMFGPVDIMVGM